MWGHNGNRLVDQPLLATSSTKFFEEALVRMVGDVTIVFVLLVVGLVCLLEESFFFFILMNSLYFSYLQPGLRQWKLCPVSKVLERVRMEINFEDNVGGIMA